MMYLSFGLGVVLVFLYDTIRILRRIIPHGKGAAAVEDILFWVLCGMQYFHLLDCKSRGEVRWFSILGIVAGAVVFEQLPGRIYVRFVSDFLSRMIVKLAVPFQRICGKIRHIVKAGERRAEAVRRRIALRRKIVLTSCGRVLKMGIRDTQGKSGDRVDKNKRQKKSQQEEK